MRISHVSRDQAVGLALVIGAAVLALAVRMYGIGDKSIWLDEGWTWWAARMPVTDMIEWTATDKHPPLYYGLLHYWINIFGDSESGLRSLSAVFGALTVALVVVGCVIAREYVLGLVSGILLALHPMHVTYSQEARMYPLIGLLAVASSLAAASLVRRPTMLRALAYVAFASALTYTHYSGFLVVGVHAALFGGYALAAHGADRRRLAMLSFGSLALVALLFMPWLPNVLRELGDGQHLPALTANSTEVLFAGLFGLSRIEQFWVAIAIPMLVLGAWGTYKRRSQPWIVFLVGLAAVAVVQVVVSLVVTPVAAPRQASPFAPGFVLLEAIALVELVSILAAFEIGSRVGRATAAVAAVLLASIMVLGFLRWYDAPAREEWRSVARRLEAQDGDVYVWRGYTSIPLLYYMRSPRVAGVDSVPSIASREAGFPKRAGAVVFSHHSTSEMEGVLIELGKAYEIEGREAFGRQIVSFTLTPR